jgi:hypothetical protein
VGGDFTHPEKGYDIKIKRKGTGKNDTEYKVYPMKAGPLGDLTWIDKQVDLTRFGEVKPLEDIKGE